MIKRSVVPRAIESLTSPDFKYFWFGDKPTSKADFALRFGVYTGSDAIGTAQFSNDDRLWGFTYEQLIQQIGQIEAEDFALLYQGKRAAEYPPIGDQLDALWKGGDAAAEMLAKVQAVKAKYPKPTE